MKKFLLSLVALLGVAGTASAINVGDVVLSENWDKLYNAVDANGKNVFSLNPWTGADANGVSYQPNFTDLSKSEYLPLLNGWASARPNSAATCSRRPSLHWATTRPTWSSTIRA